MQSRENEAEHKTMTPARRWGGLYTVGLMLLLLAFFAYHQWKQTGFLTGKFGPVEMIALYAPIVISMVVPIQRAIQGRVNPARLTEAISDLFLALGSLWLWNVFPFNFAHIADIFPARMHFAFVWLTDSVGRFILLLQVAVGVISALSNFVTYIRERRIE
ncbi:MAG: hypothetical protein WAV05_04340 [Anaerolineales bacterium]